MYSCTTDATQKLTVWFVGGRANEEGLAVSGCAIIPELKPRAPTMSERDLTRLRRRYYLRS